MIIKMNREYQRRKLGTKTVWETYKTEKRDITEEEHKNMVEAAPWFRRLGGSESLTRSYTRRGYKVIRIISTSPNKEERRVFNFEF
jgi:hypothetical protein